MKLFRNAVQNDWILFAYELKSGRNGWKSFTKFPLTCDCGRCGYVKRETLQALLIYLDLKLWCGSYMKRRYFVVAYNMRLSFMDIVRCRRCVLALMSPFLQNIWHKGSLVSIPYHQPRWFYSSIKLSVLISKHNSLAAHLTTSFELIPNFFLAYVSTPAAIQINHQFICLYYIITEQNHTRVPAKLLLILWKKCQPKYVDTEAFRDKTRIAPIKYVDNVEMSMFDCEQYVTLWWKVDSLVYLLILFVRLLIQSAVSQIWFHTFLFC